MEQSRSDAVLVTALRAGDDDAFAELLRAWSGSMLRVARTFVSTDASAEEVVQETWLAVIRGVDTFEGRSALRTWVYRILVNTAKKRGMREARTVPWASLLPTDEDRGPSVDPANFRGPGDPHAGGWRTAPAPWHALSDAASTESIVLTGEVRKQLSVALDSLPERQRAVVLLRDVTGHSSDEVCELLGISVSNQRVLLHRGRTRLRELLSDYLTDAPVRTPAHD